MNSVTTGKFIAKLRKENKLTQSELAKLLQITDKAVSRWETGEGLPDISLLPKLAGVFDVSIEEILEGNKKHVGVDSEKIKERNERIRFNNFSFLSNLIIMGDYLLTVLLVYMTGRLLLSTFFYIIVILIGIVIYMFKRVNFLTTCQYNDEDKRTIFNNTRSIYSNVLITLSMILPFYIITQPFKIFDSINIGVLLSFSSYFLYALLFSIGGIVSSLVILIIHKNKVYGNKNKENNSNELWIIFNLIYLMSLIVSILIFNYYYYIIDFGIKLLVYLIITVIYFLRSKITLKYLFLYIIAGIVSIIIVDLSADNLEFEMLLIYAFIFLIHVAYTIYKVKQYNENYLALYNIKETVFMSFSLLLVLLYLYINAPYLDYDLNQPFYKGILIGVNIIWFIILGYISGRFIIKHTD